MAMLIPLVKQLGDEAFTWLELQIENLSDGAISKIVIDEELGISLRSAAARKLHDMGASLGMDASIDLFSRGLDLTRLAEVLFVDEARCIEYPYATLLVVHLLPAKTKGWDFETIRKARKNALSAVENAAVPRPSLRQVGVLF